MTNPLAQDLGGVVRLLEKATPGEWRVSGECVIFDDRRLVCCGRGMYECCGDPDVDGAEHPIVGLLGGNPNISDVETIAACVNFLRTHTAEIAGALRDAERWQPIESAPRDGRAVILAHMGGKPYIGKWCHDTWADERGLSRGPSHWRPLPAPPTLDSAMQQGGGGGE